MNPYYEIARHSIASAKHIKLMRVPALIDLEHTAVVRDGRLKDELVITAKTDLEKWDMRFDFVEEGDTLYVCWDFGVEDPRILELLSFTLSIHPDDFNKVDFPEGKKRITTT